MSVVKLINPTKNPKCYNSRRAAKQFDLFFCRKFSRIFEAANLIRSNRHLRNRISFPPRKLAMPTLETIVITKIS